MNAILPLNILALRVNSNDNSNIVGSFAGPTASFDKMPYQLDSEGNTPASTGDAIFRDLNQPTSQILGTGIHLHFELPDYFRRGVQSNDGRIFFPPTPNRWMVVRYFSAWDDLNQKYQAPVAKAWVVLSDAISNTPDYTTSRPRVAVPLPVNPPPASGTPPYKYMGKVLDYESWDPGDTSGDFLSNYLDEDGKPYYLNAMGFIGPGFAAYYPECCSVFGFWDNFSDLPKVQEAIKGNTIPQGFSKFKVSYQVLGWINEAGNDPLQSTPGYQDPVTQNSISFLQVIKNQYASTIQQYTDKGADLKTAPTPEDVFNNLSDRLYKWSFQPGSLAYTVDNNTKILQSLDAPARVLCNGIMQEIAWDFATAHQGQAFLSNPEATNPADSWLWTDKEVMVSVGNTPLEALSAILKSDLSQSDDPQDLSNYEYLLDAFQLGSLRDMERNANSFLFDLDEALHSRAYGRQFGGNLWIIKSQAEGDVTKINTGDDESTLPLDLAEKLHALNQAQKDYDQGRGELDLRRRQLFMDWYRYANTLNITIDFYANSLPDFLDPNGEIQTVVDAGKTIGILKYQMDPKSGQIVAPLQPAAGASLATAVWTQYQIVLNALPVKYQLLSVPAPNFWTPTEPVVLVQGKRVEQDRRNGPGPLTNVRVSGQIISILKINALPATLNGLLAINPKQPLKDDAASLLTEAGLLMPALVSLVSDPAAGDRGAFEKALQSALNSLYTAVHDSTYTAIINPTASSDPSLQPALALVFTNANNTAWAPGPVDWNAQRIYLSFDDRLDPYYPVFLVWKARVDPLKRNTVPPKDPDCAPSVGSGSGHQDLQAPDTYNDVNLSQYFNLDDEAVDNLYQTGNAFTTGNAADYSGYAVLSQTAAFSLVAQIQTFIDDNGPPDTPTNIRLKKLSDQFLQRKLLAQALNGFNNQQILRTMIPQVQVQDLAAQAGTDTITPVLHQAAIANPDDNWYDYAFNSQKPIAGDQSITNFGPLRAGFMEIMDLRFVDVFGQVLKMITSTVQLDSSLQTIASARLQPNSDDTANAGKVFLPPRLLMPSRLWFRWLSAAHNPDLSADFVEMNTHPATSPVCGWVLPNHLDNSLMFYNADGTPIGSFGLEHGNSVYRSRPGINDDLLNKDIGDEGKPLPGINPHVASLMWFVYHKQQNPDSSDFVARLMYAIEHSSKFIHSANFKQATGLSVLIGRPLAITRAVLSLETYGALTPLHQGDTSTCDPFHQDVLKKRFDYKTREQFSNGNLKSVKFPLRLGELANIDDGLVGFLLENADGSYQNATLYSATADAAWQKDLVQPNNNTIQLNLNAEPISLTVLMDPRCAVHATTGILPVEELNIPPDQYGEIMRTLAVTFFTNPVLEERTGLVVPLPDEAGYDWSWIKLDEKTPSVSPLKAKASNEFARTDFSPQTVLEGWLGLSARPPLDLKDKDGNSKKA